MVRRLSHSRRILFSTLHVSLLLSILTFVLGHNQSLLAAPDANGHLVLDTAGVWRIYHTFSPPIIQQDNDKLQPLQFNVKWLDSETAPPPADWMKPETNDRTWFRGPARRSAQTPYLSRLYLRGKFNVTSPAAAGKLSLSLEYYGGVVVYLNGKEIGRGDLPAGALTKNTLAKAYPIEAFLDKSGNLIGNPKRRSSSLPIRTRTLDLSIPNKLLRKGINVLAIEVFRAAYPDSLLKKKPRGIGGQSKDPGLLWNTCEIRNIKLTASSIKGITPNVTRPAGLQVWNADTLAGDVDVDYGDRTEPLLPVNLVAPRNGFIYGKVVVGSDKPIKKLQVTAGNLKFGDSVIPSSNVSFLYGVRGGREELHNSAPIRPYPDRYSFLNALIERPLDVFPVSKRSRASHRVNGAVVPVWIRINVPKDIAVGKYKGVVTIKTAGNAPVKVPIELDALFWTAPAPQNFRTWVELIQSPDTLSVEYKTPLWSDKHFDLIANSFRLIRNTGARSLYIPAIAHTNLGNAESMIRWIKKPGGKYDWDFSIMDKYLDTAEKHLGAPKLLVLQVWEVYMNTRESTGKRFGHVLEKNQTNTQGAPLVTFVDAAGKTTNGTIPKLSDPASKAIWKELLTKLRAHLKKRGLEKTLQLGMFTDSSPNKADTKFFLEIAPDLPWVQQGHNAFDDLNGIAKVGYTATWWSAKFADDLVNRRSGSTKTATYKPYETVMTSLHGWNHPRLDAYYPRMARETSPASYWRFLCETAISSDFYRGIGRVGCDYWPALKNRRGRRTDWVNERFVEVDGYLHNLHSYVLEPHPDKQVAMTRLVALEEGVQECEARIYIEDALVNKKLAKRDPALAKRCREAMDDRLSYMWKGLNAMQFGDWGITAWRFQAGVAGHAWLLNMDWAKQNKLLYTLAGEVEKALAKK